MNHLKKANQRLNFDRAKKHRPDKSALALAIMMKQKTALGDILPAIRAAGEDVDKCWEIMLAEGTQFARRNWVRAYFAWVEVVCFLARQHVLHARFGKRVIRPSDIPEFSALSEIRYTVITGEATAEPAHGRTLDYIVFSLIALAKTFGLRLKIARGGKSWETVRAALGVRDRITHPKNEHAFHVSDKDVQNIEGFNGWFYAHLMLPLNDALRTKLKKESTVAKRTKKKRVLTVDTDTLASDG